MTVENKQHTYKVINYFDVWYSDEDGYQVNNLCTENFTININDYRDTKEIIQALKAENFLASHCRVNMFDVYNNYEFIEFSMKRNGKPFFRLELIQNY